jgi:hypothetical protein
MKINSGNLFSLYTNHYIANMENRDTYLKLIQAEISTFERNFPDTVRKARACIPHIDCIACLDTSRIVVVVNGYFYGLYYDEYTCPLCNGGKKDFIKRHYNLTDAIGFNHRQIPSFTRNSESGYSHTMNLANIYSIEFAAMDSAEEKARQEQVRLQNEINKMREDMRKKEHDLAQRRLQLEHSERRIQAERDALDVDKIPQMGRTQFKEYDFKRTSVDIHVDIAALVKDISFCISASAGNIAALPALLQGLDASLQLCWSNTKNRNFQTEIVQNDVGQTVYLRFDYYKVVDEKKARFGFLRARGYGKKEYMYVSYLVLTPLNDAAKMKCVEIMNADFETIRARFNK